MKNTALPVADLVTSHNIAVLALAETSFGACTDANVLSELLPPGYDILKGAQPDKRRGGVVVLCKDELAVKLFHPTMDNVITHLNMWTSR